ncbi:MAG: hypothetical protein H7X92_02015 [Chitinophagales bacterium]|nr:hypothetical protein [Hyphomicrobiales bacterium]
MIHEVVAFAPAFSTCVISGARFGHRQDAGVYEVAQILCTVKTPAAKADVRRAAAIKSGMI